MARLVCFDDMEVLAGRARSDEVRATNTSLVCARVWGDILGIDSPEPADDFFLLGGDNLSALAVAKRLVEWDGA